MGFDVDPSAYGKSADKMVNLGAAILHWGGLSGALSSQAGMAGSDDAAKAFADGYDKAAPQALTAMNNVATTCFNAAGLLWTTGDNYAQAEADSTPGGGPYPFVEPEGNDATPPACPSAFGGSSSDGPGGPIGALWHAVEKYVGHIWPNGHQDRLRSTADAWATASSQLDSHFNEIAEVTGLLGQQESPEIPVAIARIKAVGDDLEAISKVCADIGRSCNEYAQHIDDVHSELITQLEEFAAEAAAWEAAGLIFTEAGGELWANAALAGRLAELGGRLKTIIEAFIDLVRTIGARIGGLLAKLAEIVARTGAKIDDRGLLPPSDGQLKQLLNNPAKWGNNMKGNVIDKAMKEAIENDPFLREHLTVTPRFQQGPDIIVNNPASGAPAWYDITTTNMGLGYWQDFSVGSDLDHGKSA